MFRLEKKHWDAIYAFQRQEIEKIATDPAFAVFHAKMDHYSRIGDWLCTSRGDRVLEVGCGPGRYVVMLSQLGCEVIGVDPVDSYPTWARVERLPRVQVKGGVRAEALPFQDKYFDHIACMGALLYFSDVTKALSEMWRVMKPGGRLVIRTVNRDNFYTKSTGKKLDPSSNNLYTEGELAKILDEAGFDVQESFTYGFWPPVFTQYWWYLVNGILPVELQDALSLATPRKNRVNITIFSTRRP